MTTSRTIDIPVASGSGFTGYLAMPEREKAPGVVLIQEIFGVNSHIKQVADLYAAAGYFVLAPDLFFRVKPQVELGYTPEDISKGVEIATKLDPKQTLSDLSDTAKFLRQLPECTKKIGAVGYCFGGRNAYEMAGHNLVDAAVCYYGGQIDTALDQAKNIACPVMMHFGQLDKHIPLTAVENIRQALKGKPDVNIYVYDGADHGFNCDQRASYDRKSAMLAYGRTAILLHKSLGQTGI